MVLFIVDVAEVAEWQATPSKVHVGTSSFIPFHSSPHQLENVDIETKNHLFLEWSGLGEVILYSFLYGVLLEELGSPLIVRQASTFRPRLPFLQ